MKKSIYIAGPYTKPDPCRNTHAAIQAAEQLIAFGYVPFVPHLTHFWHTMVPHDYEFWIDYDLHWLRKCDAVLRLPGESKGADWECDEARRNGIPVFDARDDLCVETSIRKIAKWSKRQEIESELEHQTVRDDL